MNHFFSRLGADSPEILSGCSQKAQIDSSATAQTLLLPMLIWTGGGLATAAMMQASFIVCVVAAAASGAIILLLDRGVLVFLSRKGRSSVGIAARVLIAFTASLIFAHPPVFFFARGLLDREHERVRQADIEAHRKELAPQIDKARKRVADEISVATSVATAAVNTWKAKDEELKKARALKEYWMTFADHEARGWISGVEGEKGRYRRAKELADSNDQLAKTLATEAEAALKAMETAQAAFGDALKAAGADAEVARLERELAGVSETIRARQSGDLLSNYDALHHLIVRGWQSGSYSLAIAYAVISITLLGLEITPLLLKLGATSGEHGIKIAELQFKAEKDFENFTALYPTLSLKLTEHRINAEIGIEALRIDESLALDRLRAPRRLARAIVIEKSEVFEMAGDLVRRVPKNAPPEHREFAEQLARQLVENFMGEVQSVLSRGKSPGAGPAAAPAA